MATTVNRRRLILAACGLAALGGAAYAGLRLWGGGFEELAAAPVFAVDGVAIRGTDPVAYFTEGRPVAGDPAHAHEWRGAVWHFASAGNRDRFAADPERYAPQYGGFCAWAVAAKGKLYSTQPGNWSIVDGKLYLFVNAEIFAKYKKDSKRILATAEKMWPSIQHKAVGDL